MAQEVLTPPGAEQPESPRPDTHKPATPPALYRAGIAYGHFMYRIRWFIFAIWAIALVVSIPFAGKVASVLSSGGYTLQGSESVSANNTIAAKLSHTPSSSLVVFQSATSAVASASYKSQVADFIAKAKVLPHVTAATQGDTGLDNRSTYVVIAYDVKSDDAQKILPDLQKLIPTTVDSDHPAQVYITGGPSIEESFNTIISQDIEKAEVISLPVALIVLIIVFGTLIAAGLPLLLALVAVPISLAVIYVIALHTSTSVFVLNIATIIGLGISIDYSLFMTRRFREELALGKSARDAVAWTIATSGEAILYSGVTVLIGFSGLFLIGVPFMTSIGIGGMVTVGVSVLAALTLLPALLGLLGARVNALRIPFLSRWTMPNPHRALEQGFWYRLANFVIRRPVAVLVASIAVLALLGWPVFTINPASYGASSLPSSVPAQRGLDIFNQQYPDLSQDPIQVVVQTRDGSSILSNASLDSLDTLSTWLAKQPDVTGVTGLTQFPAGSTGQTPGLAQLKVLYTTGAYQQVPGLGQLVAATTAGDTTVISVSTNAPTDSDAGKALVDTIRAHDQAIAGNALKVQVGGTQALSMDFTRYLYNRFPYTILFVLAATFVVLLIMFRSLLLPLKAVLVNTLSLMATYGALVFVFQQGHFQQIFGFTSNGTIDSTIPILIFCVLFGLSMDYEVFLLSRIREEWVESHDNQRAVARGLAMTGAVITNAALLFIIVTGSFTFTRMLTTKEIGLGMTLAVLVDATIVRSLLVPATMRLLGRWNWWFPGRPFPPRPQSQA